ncbi:P-type ATPase (P-ATPase) [Phytophthora megakarya]|uniref:P-type ATPase (P-ATPase) n=1 Tax=Phytophthora megakarya TaxID=4795 RepID=A0A225WPM8_9STRA|nr:P-type ATPase (P-ATPase) [Phytophthora megakarya]
MQKFRLQTKIGLADRHAKDGCYVLGMSYREPPADWTHEQVETFADNREAVDESLSLLGLFLFRNELKDDTAEVIEKLKARDADTAKVTGDNAICGCSIARASGMIAGGVRAATSQAHGRGWRGRGAGGHYVPVVTDGIPLVRRSYVTTPSNPVKGLQDTCPTSSLISTSTLLLIFEQEVINVIYLCCRVNMPLEYPFSPDVVDVAMWWLLSDSHVATHVQETTRTTSAHAR